jgi:hypothetical protein
MAQRRSSPGRGDDRSDLDDVKELAAKARSETGGPVLKPNPGELSGVRPRRDSVVGMRLTPPPRTTGGGELPNWLWGVLGCLSVLLVGFAGLFFLGRSGKLGPLLGQAASLVTAAPAAPAAAAPTPEAPPAAPEPVVAEKQPAAAAPAEHPGAEHAARSEHEHEHSHGHAPSGPGDPAAPAAAAAPAAPPPAAAAAGDNAAVAAADDASKRGARSAKAKAGKPGEAPAVNDSAPAPAAKAAPPAKAGDDSDDDSLPGQDDVERALDALAPRMRGCFVKYQIKGTARVRLVATPAGRAESINVTGDFEDTPTGNCVESILSEAKLPTFKGPPLKLSQSYQLR